MSPSSRLLLAGALVALAAPAAAAQADPTDDYCPAPKLMATDATGDQTLFNLPTAGSPDLDLATVLVGSNADGGGRVTITIPTLDTTVPPYATGLSWYFRYTVNGASKFVDATLNPDGTTTYDTGTYGTSYSTSGSASGTFTTGSPGKIKIDLPDAGWGDKLSAMSAYSYYNIGNSTASLLEPGDNVAIAGTRTLPQCQVPPDDGSDG